MRVFSYIVSRDYGFAPNPFHGFCTLADCKPILRRVVQVGDLVVGTGGATQGRQGQLIFAMRVTEKIPFSEYWNDPRFERKKPKLVGNRRDAYGDNIYEPLPDGTYRQHHSHHSLANGCTNLFNRNKDTSVDAVLVSDDFVYWGAQGPPVPADLRNFHGWSLCAPTQGHVSRFPPDFVDAADDWFNGLLDREVQGIPAKWT